MDLRELFYWTHWIYNIVGTTSLIINIVLFYCILRKSPAAIGVYKWFLLNMTLADTVMIVFAEFIYRPMSLPGGLVFVGLSPVITMFGSHNGVIEGCITLVCLERIGASMVECFACRYVLFSSSDSQERFLNRRSLLLIIAVELLLASLIAAFNQASSDGGDYSTFIAKIREIYPEITAIEPNLVASGNATGKISAQAAIYIAILAVVTILFVLLCLISARLTIRKLQSLRSSMSKVTFRFQQQLTKLILFQLLFPIALFVVPVPLSYAINLFMSRDNPDRGYFKIAILTICATYPIINAMSTFYFVGPYRRVFTQYCNMRKRQRVSVTIISRKPSKP